MNKYQNGKIYKIVCNITNEIYIGSTIETLSQRLSKHKYSKKCMSNEIIERGDYEIILIKIYPCNNVYELEKEEGLYIKNNNCINNRIAGRSKIDYWNDNKNKFNISNTCECGGTYTIRNIKRHLKTKKHLNHIKNK
tara:strand:+ start:94 stop:504 length:411 start_codon:yes stop_codon:yes gene_type:complete